MKYFCAEYNRGHSLGERELTEAEWNLLILKAELAMEDNHCDAWIEKNYGEVMAIEMSDHPDTDGFVGYCISAWSLPLPLRRLP